MDRGHLPEGSNDRIDGGARRPPPQASDFPTDGPIGGSAQRLPASGPGRFQEEHVGKQA